MADTLRILYLGDVMGAPGRRIVAELLPKLKKQYKADLVIAQAENVTHGKGMAEHHMRELQLAGVDIFTGGNHSLKQKSALPLLADPNVPVLAPINMPGSEPAWGIKTFKTPLGDVLVVCVLGAIFPGSLEVGNPLKALDEALKTKGNFIAKLVDFH